MVASQVEQFCFLERRWKVIKEPLLRPVIYAAAGANLSGVVHTTLILLGVPFTLPTEWTTRAAGLFYP